MATKIIIGEKFGMLTVLEFIGKTRFNKSIYSMRCDCGVVKNIIGSNAKSGAIKSCGCLKKNSPTKTHGKARTKTYNSWSHMKQRCNNPNNVDFANYGGRGIKICERWNNFENFLSDMGEAPTGMSIERIDVNGDYEPRNCKWATQQEQVNNTRKTKKITSNGVTLSIKEWASKIGINHHTLYRRVYRRTENPLQPLMR